MGSVLLPAGEFRTFQELIDSAIAARVYPAQFPNAQSDARSRCSNMETKGGVLVSSVALYIIDAYKGVKNGRTDQTAWSPSDFVNVPGGGQLLTANVPAEFTPGTHLYACVVYAPAGPATIYLDV